MSTGITRLAIHHLIACVEIRTMFPLLSVQYLTNQQQDRKVMSGHL
jgi:hypothetical protein